MQMEVVLKPRTETIAQLVQDCAGGKLPRDGLQVQQPLRNGLRRRTVNTVGGTDG